MQTHGVTIQRIRALRGPNLYAYMPALHILMDIGPYEERPSNSFEGFTERLVAWMPGLLSHECSVGRPGGFIERLRRGTYLAHICEHVALELQNEMGFTVTYGRARGTGTPGVYRVLLAYQEELPARAAFECALRLTLAAMHNEPFDIAAEREQLMSLADEYRLGPSTAAIVAAARARKIPIMRLTPTQSLVQLGWGIHQKRIQAAETTNTSAIAVDLCQDKSLTNGLLSTIGIPVPAGEIVASPAEAWQVAQQIGLPVVVKPADGNQGKGVSVNLNSEEEVRQAFVLATQHRKTVIVERYITGKDYRLLVVNGKFVAAAKRHPAQVIGNGQSSVAALIERANQDPRRRPGHSSPMTRIRLDGEAELVLRQQGLIATSIPKEGQVVRLRNNANLSTGGTAIDVTDEVHPRNIQLAELAAQILSMDVAGIDVICEDITRPLSDQGGAIVEVNAAPGLRMHLHPAEGQKREVGIPIVEMLYPSGAPSRIPIIAITGTNGKTTVTRLVSHMYETARWVVGMTSTNGVYINQERIMEGDCAGPKSARALLMHPKVEVAVMETARGGILREGLAFDRCTVGVVLNVSADHLGLDDVNTVDELAHVKQVVIESVASDGVAVLNAEDPLVAEMAASTEAQVIYFSCEPPHYVIKAHLANGGQAVIAEEGDIVLVTGSTRIRLVELSRVPFTGAGQIRFQVANALAATAAAWGAGLNPAMIVRALSTFTTDSDMVPGRFNVQMFNDVEIVLDYGHNPAALLALGEGIAALGKRRTITLLNLPGDRDDAALRASVEATLAYSDEYILFDQHDRRGRSPVEVPRLLQSYIPATVPSFILSDQQEAMRAGWERVAPGDRLLLVIDEVEDALAVLPQLVSSLPREQECVIPMKYAAPEEGRPA